MENIGRVQNDNDITTKKYVDENGILITLTPEQYDALPDADKMDPNKYYFIKSSSS